MRTLAALAAGALALSGCSEDNAQDAVDQAKDAASSAIAEAEVQIPDVDWDKYGDKLKDRDRRPPPAPTASRWRPSSTSTASSTPRWWPTSRPSSRKPAAEPATQTRKGRGKPAGPTRARSGRVSGSLRRTAWTDDSSGDAADAVHQQGARDRRGCGEQVERRDSRRPMDDRRGDHRGEHLRERGGDVDDAEVAARVLGVGSTSVRGRSRRRGRPRSPSPSTRRRRPCATGQVGKSAITAAQRP